MFELVGSTVVGLTWRVDLDPSSGKVLFLEMAKFQGLGEYRR